MSRAPGNEISKSGADAALAEQTARHRRHREQAQQGTSELGRLPDPQAVLIFARVDAGWRLYASREIPSAGFDVRSRKGDIMGDPVWGVDALMEKMLIITKPTQGECLQQVMQIWANHDRAVQLEAAQARGRKAIEAKEAAG